MQSILVWILRFGLIELVLIYCVLVNILTFFLYVLDKRRAVTNKWRISERVLLLFTFACGGIGALLGMCLVRHKVKKGRFRFAAAVGLLIALIPVIHLAHSVTLDRAVRYVELTFRSEQWPAALDGYRIAFMTDMHVITDEEMRHVASKLNERDVDLLLIGGDFSMHHSHYQGTVREIAQIVTTDGIFGVEGNHDDYRKLFDAYEQAGIIPLDNSGVRIREGFYLAGVRDMWNRTPNIQEAIQGADADDFVVLLSHNPDVAMVQSTDQVDFILAGHTHGGQITFFGFPLYLLRGSITEYGTQFAYGFSDVADGTPVFTSRGIGDYYAMPRIFARPEVVLFTMYHEQR